VLEEVRSCKKCIRRSLNHKRSGTDQRKLHEDSLAIFDILFRFWNCLQVEQTGRSFEKNYKLTKSRNIPQKWQRISEQSQKYLFKTHFFVRINKLFTFMPGGLLIIWLVTPSHVFFFFLFLFDTCVSFVRSRLIWLNKLIQVLKQTTYSFTSFNIFKFQMIRFF